MRKILSEKLEEFYRKAATKDKTLDLGSRSGRHATYFPNATTVDIDPNAGPDIVADAHALPFGDGSFEVVLSREMLEHVRDPKLVLSEIRRVLVPGGRLYLSTRFLFPIHEAPNDHWRFTRYSLEMLFSDWHEVTIVEETAPFTAIGCILERFAWQSDFRYANKIIKGLLIIASRMCMRLDFLVVKQYGDVSKRSVIKSAFTSGYYVTARS